MATRTGSAAEFILTLLEQQPDRAWRISELHAQCDGRWNVDNFHETLKRLLAAGRVKKTLGEARSTWWSAVPSTSVAPAPEASAAQVPAAVHDTPGGTAAQFILDLLGKQPDLEWRIREILDASGNRWREANVYNTLTRLLDAGKVKKTLTDRQAWWSIAGVHAGTAHPAQVATPALVAAAAPATEAPHAQKSVPQPAGVVATEQLSSTATKFVVALLAGKPDRQWRIAEIVEAGGQKWTEPNVRKSLTGLFKGGKVKKTVNGGVWWSAASAAPASAAPAKAVLPVAAAKPATPRAPATTPQQSVKAVTLEQPTTTANAFVLALLTRHPDYEMQVNDIYEEAERKWAEQTISNTLDRLVKQGRVARLKDGRHVWYSAAGN